MDITVGDFQFRSFKGRFIKTQRAFQSKFTKNSWKSKELFYVFEAMCKGLPQTPHLL
jgi:hypothetical protein